MKSYSSAYYHIYRFLLRIILSLYLRFNYRFKKPARRGPKILVGNHPMVWDAASGVIIYKNEIVHTLIEDQIWSFPLIRLILTLANQIKMNRGVESIQSLLEALYWLRRGHSVMMAPEGERTSVNETREATRGIVWLALKAKVPLVPGALWISEEDLLLKNVRYHFGNRSYTVESFFPRFRARYFILIGEEIRLDQYYGKRISPHKRQEIADSVLDAIYQLREEARRICEKSR